MDVTSLLIPLLLTAVAAWGLRQRVDVYAALTDGAAEGLRVLLRIFPNLVALLTAVYMFRASGALDLLTEARIFGLRPVKAEKVCYHLHFMCPCYVGLDFTVPVVMKVRPESEKPKVEINQKDLDLDKKKGLIDVGVGEACEA